MESALGAFNSCFPKGDSNPIPLIKTEEVLMSPNPSPKNPSIFVPFKSSSMNLPGMHFSVSMMFSAAEIRR